MPAATRTDKKGLGKKIQSKPYSNKPAKAKQRQEAADAHYESEHEVEAEHDDHKRTHDRFEKRFKYSSASQSSTYQTRSETRSESQPQTQSNLQSLLGTLLATSAARSSKARLSLQSSYLSDLDTESRKLVEYVKRKEEERKEGERVTIERLKGLLARRKRIEGEILEVLGRWEEELRGYLGKVFVGGEVGRIVRWAGGCDEDGNDVEWEEEEQQQENENED